MSTLYVLSYHSLTWHFRIYKLRKVCSQTRRGRDWPPRPSVRTRQEEYSRTCVPVLRYTVRGWRRAHTTRPHRNAFAGDVTTVASRAHFARRDRANYERRRQVCNTFYCGSNELSVDLLIAACVIDLASALPAPGAALGYCAFRGLGAAEGHFLPASRTIHVMPARVVDAIVHIYIPDTFALVRVDSLDWCFPDFRMQRHRYMP